MSSDPPPARTPLGRLFDGDCRADPSGTRTADRKTVKDNCNFGYGQGHCQSFPAGAEADAVRFSLSAGSDLIWILEKDFSPVRHGGIQDADPIVRRQAEVFLENYERYSRRSSGPGINL